MSNLQSVQRAEVMIAARLREPCSPFSWRKTVMQCSISCSCSSQASAVVPSAFTRSVWCITRSLASDTWCCRFNSTLVRNWQEAGGGWGAKSTSYLWKEGETNSKPSDKNKPNITFGGELVIQVYSPWCHNVLFRNLDVIYVETIEKRTYNVVIRLRDHQPWQNRKAIRQLHHLWSRSLFNIIC